MAKVYSWRFNVRTYELGEGMYVSAAGLQNYLQETAVQASASNGFDTVWYAEHNCSWIIRRMQVRYTAVPQYGDEIQANSWVSDVGRIRSNREYELVRAQDNQRLVRARADWIFVDTETKRPQRIFPEFDAGFEPDPSTKIDLGVRLENPQELSKPLTWTGSRPVFSYEIDEMHHVNNSNYLRWIEDAHYRACLDWEFAHDALLLRSHDLEYVHEAKFGDEVEIIVEFTAYEEQSIAWQTTVSKKETGDVLVKDYAIYEAQDPELLQALR